MAEYTILIKSDADSYNSPIAGDTNKSDTQKTGGLLTKSQAQAFGKGMVAYRQVKSFVQQGVNDYVSKVQLRTGSNELQQKANFINEMVNTGLNVVETTFVAGMVGGLPGALVGLLTSTAHTLIGYAQNQNRLNTERTIENQSIQMNYIRAGARGSRRE